MGLVKSTADKMISISGCKPPGSVLVVRNACEFWNLRFAAFPDCYYGKIDRYAHVYQLFNFLLIVWSAILRGLAVYCEWCGPLESALDVFPPWTTVIFLIITIRDFHPDHLSGSYRHSWNPPYFFPMTECLAYSTRWGNGGVAKHAGIGVYFHIWYPQISRADALRSNIFSLSFFCFVDWFFLSRHFSWYFVGIIQDELQVPLVQFLFRLVCVHYFLFFLRLCFTFEVRPVALTVLWYMCEKPKPNATKYRTHTSCLIWSSVWPLCGEPMAPSFSSERNFVSVE